MPEPKLTDADAREVERANASARRAIVFVHGLWLSPTSWQRWGQRFEQAGYSPLMPAWPGETGGPGEGSQTTAGIGIEDVAEHCGQIMRALRLKPVVVGHSFGGLIAQMLAGRGLAKVTIAIEPAPFRGVLRLPVRTLRTMAPVLKDPRNRNRSVPLTYEQFRIAFANALDDTEARELYRRFVVPAPGAPLFQATLANLNPWTEARVSTAGRRRGPLLIISGERDQTFPWAIANACYQRQRRNKRVTEIVQIPARGHSITIDHGWRAVADVALDFVRRFTQAG